MSQREMFERTGRNLIVDPPSGWKYGFPRPLIWADEKETFEEFLLRNGYPQHEIDNGGAKYCRYWEDRRL